MEEANRRQNEMLSPRLPRCDAQTPARCLKADSPGKAERAGRQAGRGTGKLFAFFLLRLAWK